MHNTKRWIYLVISLVLGVSLLLGACTKAPTPAPAPKPAPAPAPAPKPTAPAPAPKPTAAAPKPTAAAPAPKPAPAPDPIADFYAKNRVTLIVPQSAGGSSDYAARIYASFWTEVTGGSMVVKNMPGGGAIPGMEAIYNAKPDGLTLGFAHAGGLVIKALFSEPRPKFDAAKFNWLGYMSHEPVFVVSSAKSPYKTLADLQKAKNLKAGVIGVVDTSSIFTGVAIELLGLDAKIIPGLDSAMEQSLALARGETNMMAAWSSYLGLTLKPGDYFGPFVAIQRERSPLYKDVPAITELVKLTPEQDKYLSLADALFSGRAPLAPPGLEKAKVDFLRAKTKQLFALKPYVQQAKLQFRDWEAPWDGERMQKAVETAAAKYQVEGTAIVNKIVRSRLVAK